MQGHKGREALCGMNAITFRPDGMAVAAYSRLSGYVYVWTLQLEWQSRMSTASPLRGSHSLFPVGTPRATAGQSLLSRAVQLSPFRVVAAPAPERGGIEVGGGLSPDRYRLVWSPRGGIELHLYGTVLGSIPIHCP